MSHAMNQEDCIRLIQIYQNYKFVWDAKNKIHHNKSKREDTWREMSNIMGQTVGNLKSKMKTLMGSYRSEKSREKKSRITGSGTDDVYESKWFAYKYLDFLSDKDNPRETQSTETEEVKEEQVSAESSQTNTTSATTAFSTTTKSDGDNVSTFRSPRMQKSGVKQKGSSEQDSDSKIMGEALKILQSSTNNSNDPYFTYAVNLGNELKKYDQHTLAHVKRAFSNILFDADMGLFSASTPNSSAPSNSSWSTPSPLPTRPESSSTTQNYEEGMLLQQPIGDIAQDNVDVESFFLNF